MSKQNGRPQFPPFLEQPWHDCEACQQRTKQHRAHRGTGSGEVQPCPEHKISRGEAEYLDVTEVAKLVRRALRLRYPELDRHFFSVRSERYAGGSSVRVSWEGGPEQREVYDYLQPLAGKTFDGMIDLESFKPAMWVDGEPVQMGAGYITCSRTMTEEERDEQEENGPVMAY